MAKYRRKSDTVDAVTFDEFVQYGRTQSDHLINGMPWFFEYKGHPVTHENDQCYLIPAENRVHRFTPNDMLIVDENGEIYPCENSVFERIYIEDDHPRVSGKAGASGTPQKP